MLHIVYNTLLITYPPQALAAGEAIKIIRDITAENHVVVVKYIIINILPVDLFTNKP